MLNSKRFRLAAAGAVLLTAVVLIPVAWQSGPTANAQTGEEISKVDRLWRDIHFLDLMRELEMTAQQRKDTADAIGVFQAQREAITALAQPAELATALEGVREALLRGDAPTQELREAVEQARPPDDGSVDQAFNQARETYLAAVKAVLTVDQTKHLTVRPMVELANELLMMAIESRQVAAAEREEWRKNAFPELREQLAMAAGDEGGIVLADFQARVDHLFALTPEQIQTERNQLVTQIVTTLNSALARDPEIISDRLNQQLLDWAVEPGGGDLLKESSVSMEQP